MKKIILILVVTFIAILFVRYLFDDMDYCLDKGGRWNHYENKCEINN